MTPADQVEGDQPGASDLGDQPDLTGSDLAELSDKELMAAHVEGNTHAFGVLFTRHKERLWAVALRTTSDPEEAADGLQEAMISAFRKAHTYRADAAVTTWLHRIVVNACLDRLRRKAVRPTVPLETQESESRYQDNQVTDNVDRIANQELRIELERALAELPFDQRAAVVLVDIEGFRVEEAAEILDCPPGTVKSRCSRGRTKLAALLAGVRNPEQDLNVGTKSEGGDNPSE